MPNYRRIIDAYRIKLMEVSPSACNEVDDQMWAEGEKWLVNEAPVRPEAWMTAQEISELYGIAVHNIRAWARRHPEKIKTQKQGKRVLYKVGEVLACFSE